MRLTKEQLKLAQHNVNDKNLGESIREWYRKRLEAHEKAGRKK